MGTQHKIWFNGEMRNFEDCTVHVLSHALHYGSSVFEGIRAYKTPQGTAVLRLDDHLKRLFYSAALRVAIHKHRLRTAEGGSPGSGDECIDGQDDFIPWSYPQGPEYHVIFVRARADTAAVLDLMEAREGLFKVTHCLAKDECSADKYLLYRGIDLMLDGYWDFRSTNGTFIGKLPVHV